MAGLTKDELDKIKQAVKRNPCEALARQMQSSLDNLVERHKDAVMAAQKKEAEAARSGRLAAISESEQARKLDVERELEELSRRSTPSGYETVQSVSIQMMFAFKALNELVTYYGEVPVVIPILDKTMKVFPSLQPKLHQLFLAFKEQVGATKIEKAVKNAESSPEKREEARAAIALPVLSLKLDHYLSMDDKHCLEPSGFSLSGETLTDEQKIMAHGAVFAWLDDLGYQVQGPSTNLNHEFKFENKTTNQVLEKDEFEQLRDDPTKGFNTFLKNHGIENTEQNVNIMRP